jgi:hypothetical protein
MNTRLRHIAHQDRRGLMPAALTLRPRVPATQPL